MNMTVVVELSSPHLARLRLFMVVVVIVAITETHAQPVVNVVGGRLIGKTVDFSQEEILGITTQVDIFLGVPFADPPVRFAPPVSKTPWVGDWNATYFRDSCSQIVTNPTQLPASEDCLYLNVFVPNPIQPDNLSQIPVMVFIPGGAFKNTGASNPYYAGTSLAASSDVIVVTVGYRVSVFGIFTTGDGEAPGNYAMLDQVAALQWIQMNIGAFGGDRDKVTIFGHSAGAGSVGFHLLSRLSDNLFKQAILQSGSALSARYFRHDPEADRQEASKLASLVGCPTTNSAAMVACLRTVDEMTLLQVQDSVYQSGYVIRVDGTFLDDTPENIFLDSSRPLPAAVMAGFTSQEASFIIRGNFPEYGTSETGPHINRTTFEYLVANSLLGSDKNALIQKSIYQEYVDWSRADNHDLDYFDAFVDYFSDYTWRSGSDATLRRYYDLGVSNLYQYYFTHSPSSSFFRSGSAVNPTWLGAAHSEELQFVLGWSFDENILTFKEELTYEEKVLSARLMKMWTNFVKSGDPTKEAPDATPDPELPAWPRYTVPELQYLELSLNSISKRAVQASGIAFWNQYIPEVRTSLESQTDVEEEWWESFTEWQTDIDQWRTEFNEYQLEQKTTCP